MSLVYHTAHLEEKIFEIMDNSLDEAEYDIVAVQHVDVGGGLKRTAALDFSGQGRFMGFFNCKFLPKLPP
jgi:hypothetical protein